MSMFEKDLQDILNATEGFEHLPVDAQKGFRALCLAMWTKGVKCAYETLAQGHDAQDKLLKELVALALNGPNPGEQHEHTEH